MQPLAGVHTPAVWAGARSEEADCDGQCNSGSSESHASRQIDRDNAYQCECREILLQAAMDANDFFAGSLCLILGSKGLLLGGNVRQRVATRSAVCFLPAEGHVESRHKSTAVQLCIEHGFAG